MIFETKAGVSEVWPKEMCETLIITFYFPFINKNPWEFKKTRLLVDLEIKMYHLLKRYHVTAGHLLSKKRFQQEGWMTCRFASCIECCVDS